MKYRVLQEPLAVCRASASAQIPAWALAGEFFSLTRTTDELSIVCRADRIPHDQDGLLVEEGWVALMLEGPFPFAMTGILASFVQPLAEAGVPIFAISTFDTDYVLVKHEHLPRARSALRAAGHDEGGSEDRS